MLHTNPGTLIFSGCQIICNLLPCLLGQLSYSTYPQGQSLCWQGLLLLYPPTVPTTHKAITSFPLSFNEPLQGKTLSHGLAEPLCLGPSTLTHKRKESGLLAARTLLHLRFPHRVNQNHGSYLYLDRAGQHKWGEPPTAPRKFPTMLRAHKARERPPRAKWHVPLHHAPHRLHPNTCQEGGQRPRCGQPAPPGTHTLGQTARPRSLREEQKATPYSAHESTLTPEKSPQVS